MLGKELITAQRLAKSLDLSVDTIWQYTMERKIPSIKLANTYRYKLGDVIQALSSIQAKEFESQYETKPKNFTYQDYLNMPEEPGFQIEIIEGEVIKDPSPGVTHQRVSRRLQRILEDYFWQFDPGGEIFNAPLDVVIAENTVIQPDIFYISSMQRKIIKENHIAGAPFLAVEVLSPTSINKDMVKKLTVYQKAGVEHYWLVDPREELILCFALVDSMYTLVATGGSIQHPDFPDLEIQVDKLLAKL